MLKQISDGRTDLVIDYVSTGNLATSKDSNGVALIQWCAYYGDVSAIKYLLEKGATLETLGDNYDLNGAVFHGHWQLCQFLIERGADTNVPLPDTRETPLHSALCKADRPVYDVIVEILLKNGADPNFVTNESVPTGSFMRDCRTKGETPLHRAAAFGTGKAIQLLLDSGAKPDAEDMNGDTPLSWASWHLRPAKILRMLCFGNHQISPIAEEFNKCDHGMGWGNGMETNLLGQPHF